MAKAKIHYHSNWLWFGTMRGSQLYNCTIKTIFFSVSASAYNYFTTHISIVCGQQSSWKGSENGWSNQKGRACDEKAHLSRRKHSEKKKGGLSFTTTLTMHWMEQRERSSKKTWEWKLSALILGKLYGFNDVWGSSRVKKISTGHLKPAKRSLYLDHAFFWGFVLTWLSLLLWFFFFFEQLKEKGKGKFTF